MGRLVNGHWLTDTELAAAGGPPRVPVTPLRAMITADGSSGFPAEAGRYHLYISLACPYAHRTLIARTLKRLQDVISVSVLHPIKGEEGWAFGEYPGATPNTANEARLLRELYVQTRPDYTGMVSVPALWDRETRTIINNESLDIIRMFDSAFDRVGDASVRLFPEACRDRVDAMIDANFRAINRGVYRSGFAKTQEAYEHNVRTLFARMDECERILGQQRYLCGDRITAADWCLFTTLFRFDAVYYGRFKCSLRHLVDYPNLWAYTRELYQVPGIAETCDLDHSKLHYYRSYHTKISRDVVPLGPAIDLDEPHHRDWADLPITL